MKLNLVMICNIIKVYNMLLLIAIPLTKDLGFRTQIFNSVLLLSKSEVSTIELYTTMHIKTHQDSFPSNLVS